MALETLTLQAANRVGAELDIEIVTTAGGFRFLNDGKTILIINNDAGALAVTFAIQPTVDAEAVATKDVTQTASERWVMGPFPTRWYNDATNYIICTVDADLTDAGEGMAPVQVIY